jgi:phosphopantothenoylcysteine decarboxylase/phosphopantothenate--cysteine ligase
MELVAVRSAEDMAQAVASRAGDATIVAMAAAVSDYRPVQTAPAKIKKADGGAHLELARTPDILRGLGQAKGGRFLIGFAAETDGLLENARRKMTEKNLDLMVANEVGREGRGFASESNAAVLLDAAGEVALPVMSKRELAERIWDRVLALKGAKG